jgi:hypothetical protein
LSVFFISSLLVPGRKELKFFVITQAYLIVLFASIIAIMGILDLFNIITYNGYSPLNEIHDISSETLAYVDNNFALLPVIFGILVIFYLLDTNSSRLQIIIYNFLLFLYSCQVMLSGSRRGFILYIIFFLAILIAKMYSLRGKNVFLKRFGSNSGYFLISTISFIILLNLFLFHATRRFQNKILENLGTKSVLIAKYDISKNVYRYISAINRKVTFSEVLWSTTFDSYDPDSGWGYRTHKTEFPLIGTNVEIVPKGSKGYLMDSTCNTAYYPSTGMSESYTLAVNLKTFRGDHYKASVYCYVSDSFDIDAVSLTVKFSCINDKIVSGNVTAFYNLGKKNVWQKLEIEFDCNEGEAPVLMSFWKKGIRDFSKQKGYVIFAYPEYEKLSNSKTGFFNNINNKGQTEFIQKLPVSINYVDSLKHLSLIPSIPLEVPKYYSMGILELPLSAFIQGELVKPDQDPIRKLASKFISEDTTYYPCKANVVVDTISNSFSAPRTARWKFAIDVFTKEFSWSQRIFGGGFNFLNWYGFYFDNDKTRSDYPHNPFLSVLLYSGIIGLLIYVFFMYKVFYYYIKYFMEYKMLAIFFLITFFFSFFSAGSPFDPPIMGFFVILPFFIHSINKKIKAEQFDNHAG